MFSEVMNEITVEDHSTESGIVFVVAFRGDSITADEGNIELFRHDVGALKEMCKAQNVSKIVFDFSRIRDWDNDAMKILAEFRRAFQGTQGSDVRVCCVHPEVEPIFLWRNWRKRIVRYANREQSLSTPWSRRSPNRASDSGQPTDKRAA